MRPLQEATLIFPRRFAMASTTPDLQYSTPCKENILKESQSQDWGEDVAINFHTDSDNSDNSENEESNEQKESSHTPHSSPLTRRLSMRAPSVHIYRVPEINELENAEFLEKLAREISRFPEPPSVQKHSEPFLQSEMSGETLLSPRSKVSARWAMVAKFARKLTSQETSTTGEKIKQKTRRGSKTIPNISEDQYV